jgi:hypothetical protein
MKEDEVIAQISHLKGDDIDWDKEPSEQELKNRRKDRESFESAVEMFKKMGDIMNYMSRDSLLGPALIDGMCRTHRTLQEKVILDLLTGLGNYGKMYRDNPVRWTDARNEFALKLCAKVYDALKDDLFWKDKA